MAKDPNQHFSDEVRGELEMVEIADEALAIAVEGIGGLWGRAINSGKVNPELTSRLKRKLGVLGTGQRNVGAALADLRKIADGEAE